MRRLLCIFIGFLILSPYTRALGAFDSPIPIYQVYAPVVWSEYTLPHSSPKKGVAIGSGFDEDAITNLGGQFTFFYTSPQAPVTYNIEVSKMVVEGFPYQVVTNSEYVMGWNEPTRQGITPEYAASRWPEVVAANPGKKFVSPNIAQDELDWLNEFIISHWQQWGYAPRVDAIGVHCYSPSSAYCEALIGMIIALADQLGAQEVWVSEFALFRTWPNWEQEAIELISWMESQPKITRYFWWALTYSGAEPWAEGFYTQLIDYHTGEMTEQGIFYRGLP